MPEHVRGGSAGNGSAGWHGTRAYRPGDGHAGPAQAGCGTSQAAEAAPPGGACTAGGSRLAVRGHAFDHWGRAHRRHGMSLRPPCLHWEFHRRGMRDDARKGGSYGPWRFQSGNYFWIRDVRTEYLKIAPQGAACRGSNRRLSLHDAALGTAALCGLTRPCGG